MTTYPLRPSRFPAAGMRGFSLIEMFVALTIGMVMAAGAGAVYLYSKSSFTRQQQLAAMQQDVRTAFEYLTADTRMVGHMGCFTGRASGYTPGGLSAANVDTDYEIGIEGYEYKNAAANAYTISALSPANITAATSFETNVAAQGVNTIPVTTIAGSAAGDGLTPGSDVLVIHTVASQPVRLTAAVAAGATTLAVEGGGGGTCSDGTTAKVSGFCAGSHGLIAACKQAQGFTVTSISGSTLTVSGGAMAQAYPIASTEVFPMQTIVYYVKKSSSGTTTSLYRRTFDGDHANGLEQELIEGVENMQVRYGVDTTSPMDGLIDGSYLAANQVADWKTVVAARMSLLLRSSDALAGDLKVTATTKTVNGVTVTLPSATKQYDRRVFTTTVALRNRIAYF
jgi:type IV pilus assembly protein PilW